MQIEARKYGLLDLIKIPIQAAPAAAILVGLHSILAGIIPTIHVLVTADFIDTAIGILQGSLARSEIYSSLFAVVVLIAYSWVAAALANLINVKFDLGLQRHYHTAVMEKRARLHYRHIENPETWDLISRVTSRPEAQLTGGYRLLISAAAEILRIMGVLGILISQVWWAALAILSFSVPLFALAVKSGKASYEASKETAKYKRKSYYLADVLTSRETVDERTLFGYSDQINELWHERYETARRIEHQVIKKWFVRSKASGVITALISVLIVVVLLNPVLTGALSVGLFISLVGATFNLVQMMSWQLTSYADQLAKHREYLRDLTEFAMLEEADSAQMVPAESVPQFRSLEFFNVSFKYPGTDKYVLKNLSFRMEAGKHYAFAGVNGSGKTTITKLIAGLYDNYTGEILLNGKSIREWHPSELKAMLSIVYQDFAKYYITVRDNIALGDVNAIYSREDWQINRAISQTGLSAAVEKLPQGIQTPLGKIKPDGYDISGGEWQRIAMARAIVNPAPLRILDEPTAALDPISESELYQEFERISRGKTTIFISHRLGSTKLADEIFVIGDGRVLEHGTHQELMALDGVYAEMYESQRSWYN
ncbi:MAG: ABC transporter ATP-binding protein [Firmicutes bacterium]|jgi:ATP-binding cassette subfamily B protein|nr:ABC transporter ATP-binding protein [Bacillota bacterium]NLL88451.1 ABC transporter ATP-binding protein [Bacillota bacterium]